MLKESFSSNLELELDQKVRIYQKSTVSFFFFFDIVLVFYLILQSKIPKISETLIINLFYYQI